MYNDRRVPPRLSESLMDPSLPIDGLPSALHRTPESAMADRIFNDPQSWRVSGVSRRSHIHGEEAIPSGGDHVMTSPSQAGVAGMPPHIFPSSLSDIPIPRTIGPSHITAGADYDVTSTRKRSLKRINEHRRDVRKRAPQLDEAFTPKPFENKYHLASASSSSSSLSTGTMTPASSASLTSVSESDTTVGEAGTLKWEEEHKVEEGKSLAKMLGPSKELDLEAVQRMPTPWSHQNIFRALPTPNGGEYDPESHTPVTPWVSYTGKNWEAERHTDDSSQRDVMAASTSEVLTRAPNTKRLRTPPSITPLSISTTTTTTTTTTVITVHSPDQSPSSVTIVSASTTMSILDLYGDSPMADGTSPKPASKAFGSGSTLLQKTLTQPKTSAPDTTRFLQSIALPKTSAPNVTTFQGSGLRNVARPHLLPKSAFATRFSAKQLNSRFNVPGELPTASIVELPDGFVIPSTSPKLTSTRPPSSSQLRITMTKEPSLPVPTKEIVRHRSKKSGKSVRPLPRLPRGSSPPPPVPSLPSLPSVPPWSGSTPSTSSSSASSTVSPPPLPASSSAVKLPLPPPSPFGPRLRSPPPPSKASSSTTDTKPHATYFRSQSESRLPRPALRSKTPPPPPLPLISDAIPPVPILGNAGISTSEQLTKSSAPSKTASSSSSDVSNTKRVERKGSISVAGSRNSILLSGSSISSPPRPTKSNLVSSPPRPVRKDSAPPTPFGLRNEPSILTSPRKSIRKSLSASSLRSAVPDVSLPDATVPVKRVRKGSILKTRPALESLKSMPEEPSKEDSEVKGKSRGFSRSRSSSVAVTRAPGPVEITGPLDILEPLDPTLLSPPHSSFSLDGEPSLTESRIKGPKMDFASALSPPISMVNDIAKGLKKASSSTSMRSLATLFADVEASIKGHKKDSSVSPRPSFLAVPDTSSALLADSERARDSRQTSIISTESRTSSPAPKDTPSSTQESRSSSSIQHPPAITPPASPKPHARNFSSPPKPAVTPASASGTMGPLSKGHKKSASSFSFKPIDAPVPDAAVLAKRFNVRKGSFSGYRPPFEDLLGENKKATSPPVAPATAVPESRTHKNSSSSSTGPGFSSFSASDAASSTGSRSKELSGSSLKPGISSSVSDAPPRVHRKDSLTSARPVIPTSVSEVVIPRRRPSLMAASRPTIPSSASGSAIPIRTHSKAPSLQIAMSVPVPDAATLARRFRNRSTSGSRPPIEDVAFPDAATLAKRHRKGSSSTSRPPIEDIVTPDVFSASQPSSKSSGNDWTVVVSPPTPAASMSNQSFSRRSASTDAPEVPPLPFHAPSSSTSEDLTTRPILQTSSASSISKIPVPFPRLAESDSMTNKSTSAFEPDPRATVSATVPVIAAPQPKRSLPPRGSTIPGLEAPRHARSRSASPARMAKLSSMADLPPVPVAPVLPLIRGGKEKLMPPIPAPPAEPAPERKASSPLPPPPPLQASASSEQKKSPPSRDVSPAPPITLTKQDEENIMKVIRQRSLSKSPTRDGILQKPPGPRSRGRQRSVTFVDSNNGMVRGRSASAAPTSRVNITRGRSSSVAPPFAELPLVPPPPMPAASGESSTPSSPRGRVSPFPSRPLSRPVSRVVSSSTMVKVGAA